MWPTQMGPFEDLAVKLNLIDKWEPKHLQNTFIIKFSPKTKFRRYLNFKHTYWCVWHCTAAFTFTLYFAGCFCHIYQEFYQAGKNDSVMCIMYVWGHLQLSESGLGYLMKKHQVPGEPLSSQRNCRVRFQTWWQMKKASGLGDKPLSGRWNCTTECQPKQPQVVWWYALN